MSFNFESIYDEVMDILHNTDDIDLVKHIVDSIEEAKIKKEPFTDRMVIPSSKGVVYFSLDMEYYDEVLESLLESCIRMEEYEMCRRISDLKIFIFLYENNKSR